MQRRKATQVEISDLSKTDAAFKWEEIFERALHVTPAGEKKGPALPVARLRQIHEECHGVSTKCFKTAMNEFQNASTVHYLSVLHAPFKDAGVEACLFDVLKKQETDLFGL